jgi:hypothetical protein
VIEITYELARAASLDAAHSQMQRAGRTIWNKDDYDLAAVVFHKLWPCPSDVKCELCEDVREYVNRCPICDWPIVPKGENGCWEGNCSYRPQGTAERYRIKERRDRIKTMTGPVDLTNLKLD